MSRVCGGFLGYSHQPASAEVPASCLQRMLPAHGEGDLFPQPPRTRIYCIRPYCPEDQVRLLPPLCPVGLAFLTVSCVSSPPRLS